MAKLFNKQKHTSCPTGTTGRRRKDMRKRDYLIKKFNKAVKIAAKNKIELFGEAVPDMSAFYISLPYDFMNKGDYEPPITLPIEDINGSPIGLAVAHNYEYDGDIFSYYENYEFVRV